MAGATFLLFFGGGAGGTQLTADSALPIESRASLEADHVLPFEASGGTLVDMHRPLPLEWSGSPAYDSRLPIEWRLDLDRLFGAPLEWLAGREHRAGLPIEWAGWPTADFILPFENGGGGPLSFDSFLPVEFSGEDPFSLWLRWDVLARLAWNPASRLLLDWTVLASGIRAPNAAGWWASMRYRRRTFTRHNERISFMDSIIPLPGRARLPLRWGVRGLLPSLTLAWIVTPSELAALTGNLQTPAASGLKVP